MDSLVRTNENSICLATKCALLLNAPTVFLKYTKEVYTCRESTTTLPPMVLGQAFRIIT